MWAVLGEGLPRLGGTSARRRGVFCGQVQLTRLRCAFGTVVPWGEGLSLPARGPTRLAGLGALTGCGYLRPSLSSGHIRRRSRTGEARAAGIGLVRES